jgi:hypothetical protein
MNSQSFLPNILVKGQTQNKLSLRPVHSTPADSASKVSNSLIHSYTPMVLSVPKIGLRPISSYALHRMKLSPYRSRICGYAGLKLSNNKLTKFLPIKDVINE